MLNKHRSEITSLPHPITRKKAFMTADTSRVIVLQAKAAPVVNPFNSERGQSAVEESNACFVDKVRALVLTSVNRRTPERASERRRRFLLLCPSERLQHKTTRVLGGRGSTACVRGCWCVDHARAVFILTSLTTKKKRKRPGADRNDH